MDTSRQLPTHGDGLLDMREPARTLLESMVNEVMDAQSDMLCGRWRHHPAHTQAEGRHLPPGGRNRALPARRRGRWPRPSRSRGRTASRRGRWSGSPARWAWRGSRGTGSAPCAGRLTPRSASPRGPSPSRARRRAGGASWSSRRRWSSPARGGGRHDAMMQMDSGGGPFPNDGLHQLFRHYPASPVCASSSMTVTRWLMTPSLPKSSKRVASCMLTAACRLSTATWHLTTQLRCASCWVWSRRLKHTIKINTGRRPILQSGADLCCFMDFSPCRAPARHRKPPAARVEAKFRCATGHPPLQDGDCSGRRPRGEADSHGAEGEQPRAHEVALQVPHRVHTEV